MSREIKFRVWDEFTNEYRYIKCIEDFRYYKYPIEHPESKIFPDMEQYTGLKDKNGKEIYEGDILLYDSNGREPEKTIIEYVDDMFHCKSTKYQNLSNGNYRLASLHNLNAVIGNIHEIEDMT